MISRDLCDLCGTFASVARDANRRLEFANSDLIPAASRALHCIVVPLAVVGSPSGAFKVNLDSIELSVPADDPFSTLKDCNGWNMLDLISGATEVCKLFRNLCAGCQPCQDRVRQCGALKLILVVLQLCCSISQLNDSEEQGLQSLKRASLQAVGNSVASFEENKIFVWSEGWPDPILTSLTSDFPTDCKSVSAMIIYNCLLGNPSTLEGFAHSEPCAISLEELLKAVYKFSLCPDSEKEEFARQEVASWTGLIVKLIATSGYLIPVHQQIGIRRSAPCQSTEMVETLLWYMVEDLVSEGQDADDVKQTGLVLRDMDCAHIANEFALILNICKESAANPSTPKGDTKRLASCLMQLIQLIAAVTTREGESLRKAMRERGLLANVVELLRSIINEEQSSGAAVAQTAEIISTKGGLVQERGLKRDLVRVLGNMCYKDRASQDVVRELGGIPLVLASAAVDDNNPYSREWSVLAIRNLCEDNVDNQHVIEGLKAMSVAPLPEHLARQGVRADLDSRGKVKLSSSRPAPACAPRPPKPWRDEGQEEAQGMVAELRGMGLEASLDPDTGLVDIAHPSAPPPTFAYPP